MNKLYLKNVIWWCVKIVKVKHNEIGAALIRTEGVIACGNVWRANYELEQSHGR